jgi:hypothetical protein
MIRTYYWAAYKAKPADTTRDVTTLRVLTYEEGQKMVERINRGSDWRDAVLCEETVEEPKFDMPLCPRCGAQQVGDLFCMYRCPMCNYWC